MVIIALLGTVVKIPGSIIGDALIESFGITNPIFNSSEQIGEPTLAYFLMAILFAPIFETFLAQFLPLKIAGRFTRSDNTKIIISATVFSLMHLPVLGFLLGAFFVGLVFAWGYIIKSKEKTSHAFWLIAGSHALMNLIAFSILLLLPLPV